ncbi:MAG: serine/threonine protein kinase, partial [Kofleriaceae bacterium]|nr:serine/threonine protein kinase [Kofleriaceae bacterium]
MNQVGRYRVVRRIGAGGMAEVFEAVALGEEGWQRRVALKRLLPDVTDDEARRMFLDEARIAAQLHHGNIVAVLDYGLADGRPFQVLEHVDGLDARNVIDGGAAPLPADLALYVVIMVAHALEYAHQATDPGGAPRGIVHRDVTPGNVLVAWSGDVKLTDFGIALARGRLTRTLEGTTKGTPSYMAPEQALAEPVDARSDLFALGCVLHTLLTGASPLRNEDQLPWLAGTRELVVAPELPADLRALITRAIRRDPDQRFATAGEMIGALAAALAARGVVDGRSRLRAHLEPLRTPAPAELAPAPARGRLDALLDLEFILDGADASGRRFHTMTTTAVGAALAEDAAATTPT